MRSPASSLATLVQAAVAADPAATAVVAGDDRLDYAGLDARSSRLGRLLVERGAGPEEVVVVAMTRSVDLVVALLAVVKSGAAYLPVDPDYPAERLAAVLATARPVLVLTDRATGFASDLPTVVVDDLAEGPAEPPTPAPGGGHPERLCYVMFTSGSTGVPKGVAVTDADVVA
ncbi:AMP-binding protein, partial [Actinosynnema sp. NPDC023794]